MRTAFLVGIIALVLPGCLSPHGADPSSPGGSNGDAQKDTPLTPIRWPQTTPVPGFFDVLVVDVKLVSETNTRQWASVGPHCGSVFLYDDFVAVEATVHDSLNGSRELLVVNGSIEGMWTTMGGEPYGLSLPATVQVRAGEDDVHIADVTWNATTQRAWIDGMEVSLPYAWASSATDGSWRIQASLHQRNASVQVWEENGACR